MVANNDTSLEKNKNVPVSDDILLNIKQALIWGISNTFDFRGRATRRQFWRFAIIYFLIICILPTFLWLMLLGSIDVEKHSILVFITNPFILLIIFFIPLLSAMIRRLHDICKKWYYVILLFIPILNLYFIYLLCKQTKNNQ